MRAGIRIIFCLLIVLMLLCTAFAVSVSGGDVAVNAGEEVRIPISITRNDGIMGFRITVEYPAELLAQPRVENGSLTEYGLLDSNHTREGRIEIVWCGTADAQGDGSLFVLVFTAREGTEGKKGELRFSYSQADTFNEQWEDVELEFLPVTVTISNGDRGSQDIPTTASPTTVVESPSQAQSETENTGSHFSDPMEPSISVQDVPTTDPTTVVDESSPTVDGNDVPTSYQPQGEENLSTEPSKEEAFHVGAQVLTSYEGLSPLGTMAICLVLIGILTSAVLILRKRRK